jgi:hypothetical protein
MDKKLNSWLLRQHDIYVFMEMFDESIKETCKKTLKCKKLSTKAAKGKTVTRRTDTLDYEGSDKSTKKKIPKNTK